ncbi:MAG TPA: hypothetical protein PKO34_08000 [Smithellaceae bacterium]|nr:hypothetical protein [Smithellaceae bacterium]
MKNSDMVKLSFDKDQIKKFKQEATRGKPYAERISLALAIRMVSTQVDIFSILDEIDYLEGIRSNSRTKNATQFSHPPLYPLWHKHFTTAKHIAKNIAIRWNLDGKGNKDLAKMIGGVAKDCGNDLGKWPAILADRLVVEGFKERCKFGMTGHWIIYSQYKGQNFYLDIATHEEGKNPDQLYEKLRKGCDAEFPFIFNM